MSDDMVPGGGLFEFALLVNIKDKKNNFNTKNFIFFRIFCIFETVFHRRQRLRPPVDSVFVIFCKKQAINYKTRK